MIDARVALVNIDSMESGLLIIFGMGVIIIAILLWMLFTIKDGRYKDNDKEPIKAYCPICGSGLRKGEKLSSSILEIGDVEIQTRIKGCPFCLQGNKKRKCPVCKKSLTKDKVILAISDPRIDRKKLAIRGCEKCYPGGFQ